MPTLLELAGAEIPDTVDSHSLLRHTRRDYIHGEHSMGADSVQFIVTETDKYIWYSQTGEEMYFDLAGDPHESHNGIGDSQYQSRISQLKNWLIRELDGREEGYSDGKKLIVGRPPRSVLSFAK